MNIEDQELENELRQLRPAPLTARFLSTLEKDFASPASDSSRRSFWVDQTQRIFPSLLVAAACFLCVLWFNREASSSLSRTAQREPEMTEQRANRYFVPIGAERTLVDWRAGEPRQLPDGSFVRPVWKLSVETIIWQDPATKARLTWSVPRGELSDQPLTVF